MIAALKSFKVTVLTPVNTDDHEAAWDALTELSDGLEILNVTTNNPRWTFLRAVPIPPELDGEDIEEQGDPRY